MAAVCGRSGGIDSIAFGWVGGSGLLLARNHHLWLSEPLPKRTEVIDDLQIELTDGWKTRPVNAAPLSVEMTGAQSLPFFYHDACVCLPMPLLLLLPSAFWYAYGTVSKIADAFGIPIRPKSGPKLALPSVAPACDEVRTKKVQLERISFHVSLVLNVME